MKKSLKYIILAFVLGVIFSLFLWDRCLSSDEVIEVRYDSTIYVIDSIDVPTPYKVIEYKYSHSTDTIYLPDSILISPDIDSALILADYLRLRLYKDTIRDNAMVAYINDSIQYNRLISRDFSYQILRPTAIIQPNKASIYIGGFAYNTGLVPYGQYNRNKWSVSLGYDPFNSRVFVGGAYKIR